MTRPPKRRRASKEALVPGDSVLFSHAMRDVRPLGARAPADAPAPPADQSGAVADDAPSPDRAPAAAGTPVPNSSIDAGLDKRTAQRLRRGNLPIEARLDLHGHTQQQAHRALDAFLAAASESGKRCVLVVTGKGSSQTDEATGRVERTSGVLREIVPRWLNEPVNRARIIAHHPAQPRDGGTGALYVLLRRRR